MIHAMVVVIVTLLLKKYNRRSCPDFERSNYKKQKYNHNNYSSSFELLWLHVVEFPIWRL